MKPGRLDLESPPFKKMTLDSEGALRLLMRKMKIMPIHMAVCEDWERFST